jgi:hypothetical protein
MFSSCRRAKAVVDFSILRSLYPHYFKGMPAVTNTTIPRDFLLSQKPIVLWIHDPGAIYNHDAVVNPDMFPNFRDGQLLRIHCPRTTQPQQQQAQNGNGNNKQDQQDQKKQHDTQSQQTGQQQSQQQQQSQTDQSQGQQSEDRHNENSFHLQLDSVIVKGHAVDKESLAKQQQLQVCVLCITREKRIAKSLF